MLSPTKNEKSCGVDPGKGAIWFVRTVRVVLVTMVDEDEDEPLLLPLLPTVLLPASRSVVEEADALPAPAAPAWRLKSTTGSLVSTVSVESLINKLSAVLYKCHRDVVYLFLSLCLSVFLSLRCTVCNFDL